jgi:hypothetical protein
MVNEPQATYLKQISNEEKLRNDVYRPDMEKFLLFTKMLRTNSLLNKAKITHK